MLQVLVKHIRMLSEARFLNENGHDVVVGLVETHGRMKLKNF